MFLLSTFVLFLSYPYWEGKVELNFLISCKLPDVEEVALVIIYDVIIERDYNNNNIIQS